MDLAVGLLWNLGDLWEYKARTVSVSFINEVWTAILVYPGDLRFKLVLGYIWYDVPASPMAILAFMSD